MTTAHPWTKAIKMGNLPGVNPFFQISAPLQILPAFVHSTEDSGSILLVCPEFLFVVFTRVSLLGKFPHLTSSRTPLPTAFYYLRSGYESPSTNLGIWELEFYNLTLFLFGAPIFRSFRALFSFFLFFSPVPGSYDRIQTLVQTGHCAAIFSPVYVVPSNHLAFWCS